MRNKYDTSMQFLEPFIWTFEDSRSILLASMLLIVLFADMPFVTNATPFFLMRTTRKRWLLGQGIYIVLATTIYMLFVMLVTALVSMKQTFVGNIWSPTAVVLGFSTAGEVLDVPSSDENDGDVHTVSLCSGYFSADALLCPAFSLSDAFM